MAPYITHMGLPMWVPHESLRQNPYQSHMGCPYRTLQPVLSGVVLVIVVDVITNEDNIRECTWSLSLVMGFLLVPIKPIRLPFNRSIFYLHVNCFDEDTNCYGVFGTESGFCYASFSSEYSANRQAKKLSENINGKNKNIKPIIK